MILIKPFELETRTYSDVYNIRGDLFVSEKKLK